MVRSVETVADLNNLVLSLGDRTPTEEEAWAVAHFYICVSAPRRTAKLRAEGDARDGLRWLVKAGFPVPEFPGYGFRVAERIRYWFYQSWRSSGGITPPPSPSLLRSLRGKIKNVEVETVADLEDLKALVGEGGTPTGAEARAAARFLICISQSRRWTGAHAEEDARRGIEWLKRAGVTTLPDEFAGSGHVVAERIRLWFWKWIRSEDVVRTIKINEMALAPSRPHGREIGRFVETVILRHGYIYESVICDGPGWADQLELLDEIERNVGPSWEISDPDRPDDIPNIREQIHNCPDNVWGYRGDKENGGVRFFGIIKRAEAPPGFSES